MVGMDWLLPALAIVVLLLLVGGFFFYRQREEAAPPTTVVKPTIEGRIAKSRTALGQSLRSVFGRESLDDEFWQSMEEALIGADVGLATATGVVERVRRQKPTDAATARSLLDSELRSVFENVDRRVDLEGDPAVVLVVGVNGAGKTTSIAKLAGRMLADGHQPLLAAADTFRAAADTQLRTWADRVGVPVVGGREGSDPAAVAFDGLSAAKARGKDVVIVDTAGRLHSKQNLMEELRKIRRVLEREGGRITESLLVLDATGGQNGIAQVREFGQAIGLTGIILTKLDGTARGGIVVAVENELGVPVKFIGVGEQVEDLMPFEPDAFVDELLADA